MEKKNFLILLSCTVIAVFLGSFAASLIIFNDGPMHRHHHYFADPEMHFSIPKTENFDKAMKYHEKMMDQQEEFFDKADDDFEDVLEKAPLRATFGYMSNAGLHVQETKGMYKVIIDLKPFNNDTKNVDVKVKRNVVTISAKYKSKEDGKVASSQVYQSMTLPSNINIDEIKKEKTQKQSYSILGLKKIISIKNI